MSKHWSARWTWTPPLMAIVILALAPPARGGSVGVHLGYSKAKGTESGNALVGGHVEFGLLPILAVHGSLDYRLVETREIAAGGRQYALDIRSIPLTVSARLYAPLRVRPFVEAGAGWYVILYDYAAELQALGFANETESTFGWHVGAGVDVPVSATVSVFGEGRAVFVDPNKTLDRPTLDRIEKLNYDSTYFAAGLSLHF